MVHPEYLVIFEGRTEVWPQPSSEDIRPENFYDRNYWDTFCLASREIFEQLPYAATPRDSGFGPEDWQWHAETVHRGVPHLSAAGTYCSTGSSERARCSTDIMAPEACWPPRLYSPTPSVPRHSPQVRDRRPRPRDRRPRFLRQLLASAAASAQPDLPRRRSSPQRRPELG